jgi:hypothetical protein
MPTHDITFEIPKKLVLSKDIQFEVKSDGCKLGSLLISKGSIDWIPANTSVWKYRLPWEGFADLMKKSGKMKRISGK